MSTYLIWFRKNLRIHDNPVLAYANKYAEKVIPLFFYQKTFTTIVENKTQFLNESLIDLDNNLRARGSNLLIHYTNDEAQELINCVKKYNVNVVCYEVDMQPISKDVEKYIEKHLQIPVVRFWSYTLYSPLDIQQSNKGKTPLKFKGFINIAKDLHVHRANSIPNRLKPNPVKSPFALPLVKNAQTPFHGGETQALIRLSALFKDESFIINFSKPDTNPANLVPSTSLLSPYLSHGCLGVRTLYWRLIEIENKYKTHTKPPVSLVGQLLWRDFFTTVGYLTDNFGQIKQNPICKQIKWDSNPLYFNAWKNSKTGYPWIDAIMIQLHEWGWIHHLARHSVACFLTRGDLYQSWEKGAKVFEELLLDGDYNLNRGNWMWVSTSAFFHQYNRIFNPINYGKQYDKNGEFIRHFIPQLRNYPNKYIYEPWKAPLHIQQSASCIIGKDYPHPIVDHTESSCYCKNRMKDLYIQKK